MNKFESVETIIYASADSGAADSRAGIRRDSLKMSKEERKRLIQEKLAAKKRDEEAAKWLQI